MAAVHAVALPADAGEGGQGGGVVRFRLRGVSIGHGAARLLHRPGSRQHRGDGGPVQGVANTLIGGEGRPRRGILGVEQVPASKGFHHRDAHPQPLAAFVKPFPKGIHIQQRFFVVFGCPQLLQILPGRLEVVAGVDAEHQHVDFPAFHRCQSRLRVVAGKADGPDAPGGLQLLGVGQHLPPAHLPVRQAVHVVNHPHVQVAGIQQAQLLLKPRPHFLHLAGAPVLPLVPDGADMPLQDKFFPPSPDGLPHGGAHLRVGGVKVYAVAAPCQEGVQHLPDRLPGFFQKPLASNAHFAHLDAGAAQRSPLHHPSRSPFQLLCLSVYNMEWAPSQEEAPGAGGKSKAFCPGGGVSITEKGRPRNLRT